MPSPDDKGKRKQMGMPTTRTTQLPQKLVQETYTAASITPETAGQERGGLTYEGDPYVANKETTWQNLDGMMKNANEGAKLYRQIKNKMADDERKKLQKKLDELELKGETQKKENVVEDILDEDGNSELDENGDPLQQSIIDEDGNPVQQGIFDEDGEPVMESANSKADAWALLNEFETQYPDENGGWLADMKKAYFGNSEKARYDELSREFNLISDDMTLGEQRQWWNKQAKSFRDSDQWRIDDQLGAIHDIEVSNNQKLAVAAISIDLVNNKFGILLDSNTNFDQKMEWISDLSQDVIKAEEEGGVVPESMKEAVSSLRESILNGNISEEAVAAWVEEEVLASFSSQEGKFTGVSARHLGGLTTELTKNVLENLRAVGATADMMARDRGLHAAANIANSAKNKNDVKLALDTYSATASSSSLTVTEAQDGFVGTIVGGSNSILAQTTDWGPSIKEATKTLTPDDKKDLGLTGGDSLDDRRWVTDNNFNKIWLDWELNILDDPNSPEARLFKKMGGTVEEEQLGAKIKRTLVYPDDLKKKLSDRRDDLLDIVTQDFVKDWMQDLELAKTNNDMDAIVSHSMLFLDENQRNSILDSIDDIPTRDIVEDTMLKIQEGLPATINTAISGLVLEKVTEVLNTSPTATMEANFAEVSEALTSQINTLLNDDETSMALKTIIQDKSGDLPNRIQNTLEVRMSMGVTLASVASQASAHQKAVIKAEETANDPANGPHMLVGGVNPGDEEKASAVQMVTALASGSEGSLAVPPGFDEDAMDSVFGMLSSAVVTEETITDKNGNTIDNPDYDIIVQDIADKHLNFYRNTSGTDVDTAKGMMLSDIKAFKEYTTHGDRDKLRKGLSEVALSVFHTQYDEDGNLVAKPRVGLTESNPLFEEVYLSMLNKEYLNQDNLTTGNAIINRGASRYEEALAIIESTLQDASISEREEPGYRAAMAYVAAVARELPNDAGISREVFSRAMANNEDSLINLPVLQWTLGSVTQDSIANTTLAELNNQIKEDQLDFSYLYAKIVEATVTGQGNSPQIADAAKKARNLAEHMRWQMSAGGNTRKGVSRKDYPGVEFNGMFWWADYQLPHSQTDLPVMGAHVPLTLSWQQWFPEAFGKAVLGDDDITWTVEEQGWGQDDLLTTEMDPITGEVKLSAANKNKIVSSTWILDELINEQKWDHPSFQDTETGGVEAPYVSTVRNHLREQGWDDNAIFESYVTQELFGSNVSIERFTDTGAMVELFRTGGVEDSPFNNDREGLLNFISFLKQNRGEYGMVVPNSSEMNTDLDFDHKDQVHSIKRLIVTPHHNVEINRTSINAPSSKPINPLAAMLPQSPGIDGMKGSNKWTNDEVKGYAWAALPFDASADSENNGKMGHTMIRTMTEKLLNPVDLDDDESRAQGAKDRSDHVLTSSIYSVLVREFQGLGNLESSAVELETGLATKLNPKGLAAWHEWKRIVGRRITPNNMASLKDKYGSDLEDDEYETYYAYELLQVPEINGWNTNGSPNKVSNVAVLLGYNKFMIEANLGGNQTMYELNDLGIPLELSQFKFTYDSDAFDITLNPGKTDEEGLPLMNISYGTRSTGHSVSWTQPVSDQYIDPKYFGFYSNKGRPKSGTSPVYESVLQSSPQPTTAIPTVPAPIAPTVVTPNTPQSGGIDLTLYGKGIPITDDITITVNWQSIPSNLSSEESAQWVYESRKNMVPITEWNSMTDGDKAAWKMDRSERVSPTLEYLSEDGRWLGSRVYDGVADTTISVRIKDPKYGGHLNTQVRYTHTIEAQTHDSESVAPTATVGYEIKKGDRLYSLAKANELTLDELMAANPEIKDPNKIEIGQVISIPDLSFNKIGDFVLKKEGTLITTPTIVEKHKVTDKKKYYTVGYGHYLDGSPRSKANFAKVFPKKNYKSFQLGKGSLTKTEALRLFKVDLETRLPEAVRLTSVDKKGNPFKAIKYRFEDFSTNLKKNIVAATYRGSWGGSPKTRELLAAGKFEEAAKEFLDSNEYRNARRDKLSGLVGRMEGVAQAIRNEAKRFKNNKKETE